LHDDAVTGLQSAKDNLGKLTNSQRHLSGKKKDDGNYTEDSSVYANAEEATNGVGIGSNRHDMNFD